MQLGNLSDLIANIALAWLSSLCLFWALVMICTSATDRYRLIVLLGWTLILTAFYFATISVSTGVMIEYRNTEIVSFARWILFSDMVLKTVLTVTFLVRRKKRLGELRRESNGSLHRA